MLEARPVHKKLKHDAAAREKELEIIQKKERKKIEKRKKNVPKRLEK